VSDALQDLAERHLVISVGVFQSRLRI